MPKRNITLIKLPPDKPDRCVDCPMIGLVPKSMLPKGSKETHVCMATHHCISRRGAHTRASGKDKNHPLRRPCDRLWSAWMKLPRLELGVNINDYLNCRIPYQQTLQCRFIFHRTKQEEE